MTSTSRTPRRITKAIVPAAGLGTRLMPLTKAVPKELMPLGRKPVLQHVVDESIACGITDFLFVISSAKEAIHAHFGDSAGAVRFHYAYQREQKGLADAVYCGREFAGSDPFAVVLGDSVIETRESILPFRRVLDTYENTLAAAVIVVQKTPREELSKFGIVKPKYGIGPAFQIDGLVEKPDPGNAPSDYSIAGRYAFDPVIFDYIERTPPGAGGEMQLTDSVALMLADGLDVWCVALTDSEARRDIGTFDIYFEALLREIEKER